MVVVCSINGWITDWNKEYVLRCVWSAKGNEGCKHVFIASLLQNTPSQVLH